MDSEIKRVIAEVQGHRLPLLTGLVERLTDAGRLSTSVSPGRALDILWMLSSFEAFDQLFAERQLPVEEAAEVLADVAVQAVIRERPNTSVQRLTPRSAHD